jgi:hypothetical protein
MSTQRPTVAPQLIAAMIESTPERVRRRLDRTPDVAATWDWRAGAEAWSVDSGGETVTLPRGHVVSVDQLTCSCLLAPRCFHVLACLTRLQVVIVESAAGEEKDPIESAAAETGDDVVETDEKQQHAARALVNNVAQLLRVGVANAGVVVQSGLLRAVHQCLADGLHRLAALGLRVSAGTSEFRVRAPAADPAQLAEDVADVLETSRHVLGRQPAPSFWIGTARRKQMPVRPRKLHGLFAEPIITLSGFAGAAVYFLGEDDHIYTVSEVRPGDAQRARDAYLGGIEIGPMIQPAKQLARGLYLGTDLTASLDGRLGRGKGIKIVDQGPSTWQVEPIQERFRRPLPEQWNAVYASATLPADARPAGWDFVFLAGAVLGAVGPELLFQSTALDLPIRLAIANESPSLFFRENLRMLSHAPGLRLQVIGRVDLREPRIVFPLAITHSVGQAFQPDVAAENVRLESLTYGAGALPNADEPHLEIPKPLADRVCLGLDEIQRNWLIRAQASAVVLGTPNAQAERDHLGSLKRRWIATMLSGIASQRMSNTNTLAAETATLHRMGLATGAALLDSLSRSHSAGGAANMDTFLAAAVYLRRCSCEFAKSRAMFINP